MMFKYGLALMFILFLLEELSCKRTRKSKASKLQKIPHQYEIFQSKWLPSDMQVTTFLHKDEPKIFYYWSMDSNRSLHVILMSCSSLISWTMLYLNNNNSSLSDDITSLTYKESTKDLGTETITSKQGIYVLSIVSREQETYAHIYISTEDGGPQALRSSQQNNLKLSKKGKKDWLTVKWQPSLVDPHKTFYCLAINTESHYRTMCAAEVDIIEHQHDVWEQKSTHIKKIRKPNSFLECVGRKTQIKIPNINEGITYYFDLFALNKQSNFTYLLDSTTKKFDSKDKFIPLKDGKFVSARRIDNKAIFRFKVGRKSGKHLHLYVIPCGSYIYLDVRLKQKTVFRQIRIDRFKNITINNVTKGNRYIVKVIAPQNEFTNTGVEIFATTRSYLYSPIPTMPENISVIEYESMKKCDSVTIGWMPTLDRYNSTYCLVVKEGNVKENEEYNQPNQCGLENRLRKSLDFAWKRCFHTTTYEDQPIITQKISNLKPGRSYSVLVSVRKEKGRSLSYNILPVSTLNSCRINPY
ncbi:protein NDNF-like [Sitophilus oryzae]|uniref:Protein NDNF n=1 Tax=Sitophilus oryzae TaxID=7048 RepID=A0A6J2X711_SITOR|nr:protein NDNF-like [Sitophilus oryzae]